MTSTTGATVVGIDGNPYRMNPELVRDAAVTAGVCVRPIVQRLVDTQTGEAELIPIPCGATLASRCPSCAERARRLRMQQCREGWHLEEEPPRPEPTDLDEEADDTDEDEGQADEEDEADRRVRSTRRRDDVADLPRLKVEDRTIGRTFTDAKTGKTWRPSMFVTLTLPSYGRVRADGSPVDPGSYDYRRAALDAMHLPKLWDRFVQNLRRAVGFEVQYFAALEPQRRLAPHIHAAIRGAIPRVLMRQVVAATYASVWWPSLDEPVYTGSHLPVWRSAGGPDGGFEDPDTGAPLPTWEQALDQLDEGSDGPSGASPAHVARFGAQLDMQGIVAASGDADRRIGYLTKYLGKSMADPISDGDPDDDTPSRRAHIDRLHREVMFLPCSPRCANWLRYGIQPQNAHPEMTPGHCGSKAHDREHLGCGGRRVLVSRRWTGKTLTAHKADRIGAVRAVLEAAGIDMDDSGRCSATVLRPDGRARYAWEPVELDELPTYTRVIGEAIAERTRWRQQYEQAKQRAGPMGAQQFSNSATQQQAA